MTPGRAVRLAAALRERIALGEYAGTGALESEAALGAQHGVSRVTVRRALSLLREQGLVEPRRGAGWFVAGSYHQRLALGTFHHAPSAIEDAEVVRTVVDFSFRPVPAHLLNGALDLSAGDEVLYARSVRRVDGEPLDLVHEWVPASVGQALSRADAEGGIWASLHRAGHRVDAVRQSVTAGLATADDARLLSVPAGAPLLLVRRVARDATGRPLALADHRYLAHRFALDVEFRGGPGAETPGLRPVAHPTSDLTSKGTAS